MSSGASQRIATRAWRRFDDAPRPIQAEVRTLLWRCDGEFTPPLSARPSTGAEGLDGAAPPDPQGPVGYFAAMRPQALIVAGTPAGPVNGFMSLARNRHLDDVDCVVDAYVTTIIVAPAARGAGVARALYAAMLRDERERGAAIAGTRTWSGNHGHLALLSALGFEQIARLPDHRGAGVDTIYLAKRLSQGADPDAR